MGGAAISGGGVLHDYVPVGEDPSIRQDLEHESRAFRHRGWHSNGHLQFVLGSFVMALVGVLLVLGVLGIRAAEVSHNDKVTNPLRVRVVDSFSSYSVVESLANPIVSTSSGRLQGLDEGEVWSFLGVPFAEPPV